MKAEKVPIIFLVGFICGILFAGIGMAVLKKSIPLFLKAKEKIEEKRIINPPKAKKPLIISDFEDYREIKKWNFINADAQLSNEHIISGKYSLKICFKPSGGASVAKIENYFEKNQYLANWLPYEVLHFDIFNPGNRKERMILQIKDSKGYRAKINLYLKPNTNNTFEIDIGSLGDKIKLSKISQFNLFLWNNRSKKIFYLDNVKLLPQVTLGKKNKDIWESKFLPKQNESVYKTGDYFAFDDSKWQKIDEATNISFIEVPLVINNYLPLNLIAFHFSGGVPFGRGQLQSLENLQLTDKGGNNLPFQGKILSRWPEGSIRWAFFDVKTDIGPKEKKRLFLRYGKKVEKTKHKSKLIVKEYPDKIVVNTGILQFSLDKENFYLFDKVWLDENNDNNFDESELISSKGDLVLVHKGKRYRSSLDRNYELTIEEKGPVKVSLRAKGYFTSEDGEKFSQFVVRISAIEGSNYIKVQHSFIYTGYPENRFHYLYQGKKLPQNETIEAIYIETPLKIKERSKLTFAADNQIMEAELFDTIKLWQNKFNSYLISRNNQVINSGSQLSGWIDVSTEEKGLSVGIKNFWQQFPKGFHLDKKKQSIITYLWPKEAGELDFKTTSLAYGPGAIARGSAFGIAKTHEVFFYFHKDAFDESQAGDIMEVLSSNILLSATAEWIADTKVLGKIRPYNKFEPAEEFLSRLFDWGVRQIRNFHWYGMIDFGDTLSWYRKEAYDKSYQQEGWHPEGRWGWFNCEAVGTHSGALIQFLRTGNYKYFDFGANLTKHIMDIDTVHYNTVANDKRLRGEIPDDYSQVGSMHRHNGNHWGGRNEEASHTNVYGLLLYYYISADARARDVIEEVGEFFLNERITYYKHPDIAPQRALANILWGDVLLYELTGDERYKKAADKWAQIFYEGQKNNGAWTDNYNPLKRRWEGKPNLSFIRHYTLPALISYHQLTANKAIAESIIKATDFVIDNEKYGAYFDASAYCYWLTADTKYLDNIKERLSYSITRQRKTNDPLWDGMIYQKATYARVMEYLYKVPFAFEVITDKLPIKK